jgi:putative CocE/NonD family hydrolase
MRRVHLKLSLAAVLAVSLFIIGGCKKTADYRFLQDVQIPMRDGVTLSADISLPEAEGRYPVLLARTPYGKGNPDDIGGYWVPHDFAFVIQDCRGTGSSGGEWDPGRSEKSDGLDTHAWLLEQPWCNGRIGTLGGSYLGSTQWMVAPYTGESHRAMITTVPLIDWYRDCTYVGGALNLATIFSWATAMLNPTQGEGAGIDWDNWDWDEAFRVMPLSEYDVRNIGKPIPWLRDWLAHPTYDDYWAQVGIQDDLEDIDIPNITISSWYDIFLSQALDLIPTLRKSAGSDLARRHQHLIIGPWGHGPGWFVGDREFGSEADYEVDALELQWFDHFLKDMDTGIETLPPYRLFVMGRNVWRDADEWPLPETEFSPYYFHSNGSANTLAGDGSLSIRVPGSEAPDRYTYDPDNPVPTRGGSILFEVTDMGPVDQREVEQREDVLVYTSEPLINDLEVVGPVEVVLFAASDARDTDWTAKLVDVNPDGRAFNLCDGIIRARYRIPNAGATLLEPGEIYRYEIDLWGTGNVFLTGHGIRVEISSSNFPHFDRNPNTGGSFYHDSDIKLAHQIVYHDEQHPSHILLPVIPVE